MMDQETVTTFDPSPTGNPGLLHSCGRCWVGSEVVWEHQCEVFLWGNLDHAEPWEAVKKISQLCHATPCRGDQAIGSRPRPSHVLPSALCPLLPALRSQLALPKNYKFLHIAEIVCR
jgi:hypothetical protein